MNLLPVASVAGLTIASALCSVAEARDLPDLVITKAELKATGKCGGEQALIVGKVAVKNVGIGRGQIFTTKVMLRSGIRGRPEIIGADRFVNSLRPGDEVFVTVHLRSRNAGRVSDLAGSREVQLTVDPVDVFRESNERNNTARATVVINCP
ncbi:MAG: CARDB domain-containing protein [Hyphomicrobiaceae bacterium]